MRWLWGHIYTETDYRTAMCDSDCYNMFVEAVMERLSTIGVWNFKWPTRFDFPLGTNIYNSRGGPSNDYLAGIFEPYSASFGRDWYKGFNDINLRLSMTQGWAYLQGIVNDIKKYFVRNINEDGSPLTLTGRKVLPGWDSGLTTQVQEEDRSGVVWVKNTPLNSPRNGWTRTYPREIAKLSDAGREGQVAYLRPAKPTAIELNSDNVKSNEWGMRNWIFEFDRGKWNYAPTKKVDVIKRHGLIQAFDYPGPWILNDIKNAIDDLEWTHSSPIGVRVGFGGGATPEKVKAHFFATDKILVTNSQSLNGVSNTNNGTPNPGTGQPNQVYKDEIFSWSLHQSYFEIRKYPGVYPGTDYVAGVVASNSGISDIHGLADPTAIEGSWPYPSYITFGSVWNDGITGINPQSYAWKSEGIKRTIEIYDSGFRLLNSSDGKSWNDTYAGSISNGRFGIIKWDFKYSKNRQKATWKGFPNVFLWSD